LKQRATVCGANRAQAPQTGKPEFPEPLRKEGTMRRILVRSLAVLAAMLLSSGAAPSDALASGSSDVQSNNAVGRLVEGAFKLSTRMACARRGLHTCSVVEVAREQLAGDVGYYRVLVKVGDGPFDVIRLNRIVREHRGVPVRTKGSFFFLHGSSEDFRLAMLTLHDGAGMGLFLAQNDIDVWGIDLRYVQIPADATDVSSAATWGYDVNIKDILIATRAARLMRALTGQGFGKVVLSGHSSGAAILFSVADAEAALPAGRRDVGGLAPIDTVVKLPDSAADQAGLSCYLEGLFRSFVDGGMPIFDNLASIDQAKLAASDPNGISPYYPPLTNYQNQLQNIGALGFYPLYPFHPLALTRDADGNATGMVYSSINDRNHHVPRPDAVGLAEPDGG
jgi:hypothetical protein